MNHADSNRTIHAKFVEIILFLEKCVEMFVLLEIFVEMFVLLEISVEIIRVT